MKIGSLCSGYGGLDLAVAAVLGGQIAWHSEIDEAACKVLEARWPDVPNIGDMTKVDWHGVPRVAVLAGGTPCQDVSTAGPRHGMRAGNRSGLWSAMADAIDVLRPRLVVWENVRGVLSAEADSAVEPCPGCLGDHATGDALRALGRVLGDLADLGYDARWCGLRASDLGAPHERFRVFVTAHPADLGHERPRGAWGRRAGSADCDLVTADADHATGDGQRPCPESGVRTEASPDTSGDRWGERWPQPAGQLRRPDVAIGGSAATTYTDRDGFPQLGRELNVQRDTDRRGRADVAWGPYEPAIRRWEAITRPAPAPREPGRNGERLSPRFVEWLMGLPAGHVTGVPGISRNDQLKILGNGVVPQQAEAALRHLLAA